MKKLISNPVFYFAVFAILCDLSNMYIAFAERDYTEVISWFGNIIGMVFLFIIYMINRQEEVQ